MLITPPAVSRFTAHRPLHNSSPACRLSYSAARSRRASAMASAAPVPPAAAAAAERRTKVDEIISKFKKMFPEVENMSVTELHERLEDPYQQVVVIDVRRPEEQAVSMIPGALTKEEYEARQEELQGRPVVCYCTLGYRSSDYAQQLKREGVEAQNLAGSIVAWTHEGYTLVEPPQPAQQGGAAGAAPAAGDAQQQQGAPTKRVHVYAKQWALQGEGYEPVAFSTGGVVVDMARTVAQKVLPSWLGGGKR